MPSPLVCLERDIDIAPVILGANEQSNLIIPDNQITLSAMVNDIVYVASNGFSTSVVVTRDGSPISQQYFNGPTSTTPSIILPGTYFTNTASTCTPATFYTATGSSTIWNSSPIFTNGISYPSSICGTSKIKRGPMVKKSIRSSIKRAMKLIANFGMEEDVRIFLGGDTIEVSHPDSLYKFVVTKYRGNLLSATERAGHSTPYKLELYTKTDVHIANLCVVMEGTPLLDQVLALSMFVKSGCEDDILHKANYNQLTQDKELRQRLAGNNPIMRKKLRVDDIEIKSERANGIALPDGSFYRSTTSINQEMEQYV